MSVSKPETMKRSQNPPPLDLGLIRTESVNLQAAVAKKMPPTKKALSTSEEGKNLPISSHPETQEKKALHPKGHKAKELKDVWESMDSQAFLHLTDTLTLGDVWVQPMGATPDRGNVAIVTMKQLVNAPHIKHRTTSCKMSCDDLIQMLYLCDCLSWELQNMDHVAFDDWLNIKSAQCVKAKGVDEATNRAKLANFILTQDDEFTFYPSYLHNNFGIFFRRICYHSYKTDSEVVKINNPGMIKCKATKGQFEYMIEARILPVPTMWFDDAKPTALHWIHGIQPPEEAEAPMTPIQ